LESLDKIDGNHDTLMKGEREQKNFFKAERNDMNTKQQKLKELEKNQKIE